MKLFETALKNFAILGLECDESSKKFVYTKNYFAFQFSCIVCIVLTFLFLIYDAKTFDDYTEALFILSTGLMQGIISVSISFKMNNFFNFIENCKNVFDESKRNHLYNKVFINVSKSWD